MKKGRNKLDVLRMRPRDPLEKLEKHIDDQISALLLCTLLDCGAALRQGRLPVVELLLLHRPDEVPREPAHARNLQFIRDISTCLCHVQADACKTCSNSFD
jgi:hypothetical protein